MALGGAWRNIAGCSTICPEGHCNGGGCTLYDALTIYAQAYLLSIARTCSPLCKNHYNHAVNTIMTSHGIGAHRVKFDMSNYASWTVKSLDCSRLVFELRLNPQFCPLWSSGSIEPIKIIQRAVAFSFLHCTITLSV